MTSENNRAPLLYCIKLCALFQINRWIQTWVTVRKHPIRVKISDFFCPVWPWNLMEDLLNNRAPLLYYIKLCASFQSHEWIQSGVTVRKRSIWVKICDFFVPCDLGIWRMTLKNNRAPLLCCFKLCASFHSHQWIQTGVTVRKRPIWVKIDAFSLWPQIWQMTLKYNRTPLLCYFKLCSSFRNHWWIQSGVTVRKRPIWVDDFISRMTLKFDGWAWKTIGHLS